ncbi:MAG: hypothetical protein ACFFAS_20000 [Promethearchaeota archaeon]
MKKYKIVENESNCCGPSQAGFKTTSLSPCCSDDTKTIVRSKNADESLKESRKILKMDIFVPLEACSCVWVRFMNLVFNAITPYIKYIQHETKSLNSEEARKLKLSAKCVVIDGKKIYTSSLDLKRDLPALLEEKGLKL